MSMPDVMDPSLSNRAAPPGSMRYFAALYAPENARDYVYAMYAIEAEVRDSAAANHDVAHTRLRWWREEIERLSQGRPQHPASKIVLAAHGRPDWSSMQQLLLAAEVELSRMTFDSERELNAYLERSGGVIHALIAQLTNADALTTAEQAHARRFGAIARHAEVLRDLRTEARNGHIYLPLQALDAAKVAHNELSAETASPALRAVVASEARRSLDEFKQRHAALSRAERMRLRPVLVFAALCARLLQRLANGKYSPQPPLELGAFERAWLAWRTAVRAR